MYLYTHGVQNAPFINRQPSEVRHRTLVRSDVQPRTWWRSRPRPRWVLMLLTLLLVIIIVIMLVIIWGPWSPS